MELDKKAIKALAADTRVDILKSLSRRRKLPSELSRSLGLAPSTVVEHLKVLEDAGLVSRTPHGPKWIYYELTDRGRNIVQPTVPFRFILTLLVGAGMTVLGATQMLATMVAGGIMRMAAAEAAALPEAEAGAGLLSLEIIFGLVLLIGLALLILSIYKLRKK